MRGRTPIYSFNGGELSSRMAGRSDLDGIYDRGLARMMNFVATIEGPALKRSGFRYIKPASLTASWLSSFIYNTTQSYAMEWGEQRLRFFTNGGQIEADGAPYEVATHFSAAQAERVSKFQSFDRQYMVHAAKPPAMLTRTGAETFSFGRIPIKNGPYKDWNIDRAVTVSWTGDGHIDAIATITCSGPIFKPGHVGGQFIFETRDFRNIKAWQTNVKSGTFTTATQRRSDGKVYSWVASVAAGSDAYTGDTEPTHTDGQEWDGSGDVISGTTDDRGGVLWQYEHDRYGAGEVVEYVDANTVKIKVTRRLPTLGTPTYKWALGAFSDAEGWPHLVTVWGQRLIFIKGTEVLASVVGDFFNFSPLTTGGIYAPDMSFRRPLGIADPPTWIHADKEALLAGCARSEVVIGQINRSAGLSSDNLMAQSQSGYGSAECWPVPVGTALVFIQRGGRKIREATFGMQEDRFVGPNINIYARHITRSGINWLSFQQEPEEMLWAGRADGVMIAHPHNPEQAVKGFARVELAAGGAIAGCSIPSEDGERDELWILAELPGLNGAPAKRSILQLGDWWDEDTPGEKLEKLKDAFFVDYGVSYDGPPKADFTTGLDHLEGRTVRILADGAIVEGKTVVGGAISLAKPASKVHIGLGYQAVLRLLRPEMRGSPTVQGLRKRILRLWARLIDSASLLVTNDRGEADRMFDRPNTMKMGDPTPLFTGDTDNRATGAGSSFEGVTEIVSDDPLPSIVSMLVATWDVEEFEP